MLEFLPPEKVTKEVRASFDLLVSAFISLAEDLVREEQQQQGEDTNESPAIPTVDSDS